MKNNFLCFHLINQFIHEKLNMFQETWKLAENKWKIKEMKYILFPVTLNSFFR